MSEPVKRKIKVRAMLVVSETEYVLYGEDGSADLYGRMVGDLGLWETDGPPHEQAMAIIEFEVEVTIPRIPTVTVVPIVIEQNSTTIEEVKSA